MSDPKPFQEATVARILEAFNDPVGSHRFLVADEVGLGKTVVAKALVKKMMEEKLRPLVVFYVCSNLTVARQNRNKLLEVIPHSRRDSAISRTDRLTLMATSVKPSDQQLAIYTLTPDTSIPLRSGKRKSAGRCEERALIFALMESAWPSLLEMIEEKVFQRSASKSWGAAVNAQRSKITETLLKSFVRSVREEFNLGRGPIAVQNLVVASKKPLDFVAHLRNALASCAIRTLTPDLVIFDEFQRFRDLLATDLDNAERRVISVLRGDDPSCRPGLLLLSATPYRMYSRRWEEAGGSDHHTEFLSLLKFLWGTVDDSGIRLSRCQKSFGVMEKEIRKGTPASSEAVAAKAEIETLLSCIVARTERGAHPDGWDDFLTEHLPSSVVSADIKTFKHLADCFQPRHHPWVVPYWSSIPIPMQTMARRYVARRDARHILRRGISWFRKATRDKLKPFDPPHPKMRALRQQLTPESLSLPWVSPSFPWWPLRGKWKSHSSRKALIFSRFRAVPQAVAALLSYDVEVASARGTKTVWESLSKRRLLQPSPKRPQLLGLFHPSIFLSQIDPLLSLGSHDRLKRNVRDQIKKALKDLGITVEPGGKARRTWILLARLDAECTKPSRFIGKAWRAALTAGRDSLGAGSSVAVKKWEDEAGKPIGHVTPNELEDLVDYSLSSPGVILARALKRHWPDVLTSEKFTEILDLSWNGFRSYLDHPVFAASLEARDETYPDAIRKAVKDGNLEAVLDEHFWILRKTRGAEGPDLLKELRTALKLRTGSFKLTAPAVNGETSFTLRCHAALPFVDMKEGAIQEGGDAHLRTEDIQKAFNSPFWPHVLATTSVGQEGLDFHLWCDTVVHWDLPRNPVDLEQREGRIQRFGGLSIRQAIASTVNICRETISGSPWETLESLAHDDECLRDASGMSPWWVCRGARSKRWVFNVPLSEEHLRLEWLKQQRFLYRMVLGQPNQEDLVEILSRKISGDITKARAAMINLSPFFAQEMVE